MQDKDMIAESMARSFWYLSEINSNINFGKNIVSKLINNFNLDFILKTNKNFNQLNNELIEIHKKDLSDQIKMKQLFDFYNENFEIRK